MVEILFAKVQLYIFAKVQLYIYFFKDQDKDRDQCGRIYIYIHAMIYIKNGNKNGQWRNNTHKGYGDSFKRKVLAMQAGTWTGVPVCRGMMDNACNPSTRVCPDRSILGALLPVSSRFSERTCLIKTECGLTYDAVDAAILVSISVCM